MADDGVVYIREDYISEPNLLPKWPQPSPKLKRLLDAEAAIRKAIEESRNYLPFETALPIGHEAVEQVLAEDGIRIGVKPAMQIAALPDFRDPAVRREFSRSLWRAMSDILLAHAEEPMVLSRDLAKRLARIAGQIAEGEVLDLITDAAAEHKNAPGREGAGEEELKDRHAAVVYYWAAKMRIIPDRTAMATLVKAFGVSRQRIYEWIREMPLGHYVHRDQATTEKHMRRAAYRFCLLGVPDVRRGVAHKCKEK